MLISVRMKPYSEFKYIEEWEHAYIHNQKGLEPFCKEKGITMEELGVKIAESKKRFLEFLGSLINESGEDE